MREDAVDGGELAIVEAWRVRQRDGVKNEEGAVVCGGCEAREENFERGSSRAVVGVMIEVEESDRLGVAIENVKNAELGELQGRCTVKRKPTRAELLVSIIA